MGSTIHVLMDPDLTATVPCEQYLYTGMDAYIHCIEALAVIPCFYLILQYDTTDCNDFNWTLVKI
jgi:alcohol dehydrogenase class IV